MRRYRIARVDVELEKLLYSINLNRGMSGKSQLSMRYFTFLVAKSYNKDWKRAENEFVKV